MILPKIASALILASLLSVTAGTISSDIATADSIPPTRNGQLLSQVDSLGDLPQWLADTVRWDLAIEVKTSPGRLFVTDASRQTWPNSCLGLPRPQELCNDVLVPGWRILFSDGDKSWTYRADMQGRIRRLESQLNSTTLPNSVRSAVLKDAFERSQQPATTLRITSARKQTWPDSCLGLNDGVCAQVLVPGWEVTVALANLRQRWIYRTNRDGSQVRLVRGSDRPGEPSRLLINAVFRDLSARTNIPTSDLQLVSYTRKFWDDNCLELRQPRQVCDRLSVDGWRLVVSDDNYQWFYRTNLDGRLIRFEPDNLLATSLPNVVTQAVLKDLSEQRNLPISQLQITEASRQTWFDSCLGISMADVVCTPVTIEGWRVIITHNGTSWVYRTDSEGQIVVLETGEKLPIALPENISQSVLQDVAQRSRLPVANFRIIDVQRRQWPDSCLGLQRPGFACALVIVPGWLVTVDGGDKIWVYHANESGSQVLFNPERSF